MRRIDLIGTPLDHARSPELVNALLTARGEDVTVVRRDLAPDGLADYVAAARNDPTRVGAIVTTPLKQAMVPHLAARNRARLASRSDQLRPLRIRRLDRRELRRPRLRRGAGRPRRPCERRMPGPCWWAAAVPALPSPPVWLKRALRPSSSTTSSGEGGASRPTPVAVRFGLPGRCRRRPVRRVRSPRQRLPGWNDGRRSAARRCRDGLGRDGGRRHRHQSRDRVETDGRTFGRPLLAGEAMVAGQARLLRRFLLGTMRNETDTIGAGDDP